jgi:lipopolysaccharide export system protein LptA
VRLTIERLRTLVLTAGVLLVVALIAFLGLARWKTRQAIKELPKRLGADIQRQANEFVYTQSNGRHTLFKIRASRLVQLKNGGKAELENVQIELYGQDGSTVDRISGGKFQYDQKAGIATAAGPVEITIMKPNQAPVVAPKALPNAGLNASPPLANAAAGQIDVKTSGLIFNQKTGVATTAQRVEFSVVQGSGSSMGATFDSQQGQLVLDQDVQLNVRRGPDTVILRARHGEFLRDALTCDLRGASASYRNGEAMAGQAHVLFREDGSAVRLDARDGFSLTSATGARIAAPTGSLEFNEKNQPTKGNLEGGVTMQSENGDRKVNGAAPTAQLAFAAGGVLRHAHMERGVVLHSEQSGDGGAREVRDWRSPVADVDFRNGPHGALEIASVQGTGGVEVTGQMQRPGAVVVPSQMGADVVTAKFGAHQELSQITGTGRAHMDQTTSSGVHQQTTGDRLTAQLASSARPRGKASSAPSQQIQSATIEGHVVLTEQQPAKSGEPPQPSLRATAGKAVYDGASEWLRLTDNPWVDDGGLQLAADRLDVSQASGDALAHGNVKATWLQNESGARGKTQPTGVTLGGEGPAHVIAADAELHKAKDQAVFRGKARLWQGANSISAPEIVLDRKRQVLTARGSGAAQPVNLVLLSSGGLQREQISKTEKRGEPSVITVRAGDLKYSASERKAVLHAGSVDAVQANTSSATTSAREVEILLLPSGKHAGPSGEAAQLERLTARGNVVVASQGRKGTGEQLVYSGETGQYTLTGTASSPPRLTDPAHGTVTGQALIFNSRDDSVSIEGRGHKTLTQTVAPR